MRAAVALLPLVVPIGCATGGQAPKSTPAQAGQAAPAGPGASSGGPPFHMTSPVQSAHEAVTEAVLAGRFAQTAADIPPNAAVPRVALADVVYPASEEELKAMGGFAILFVSVLCHDSAELPVDRVEARVGATVAKLVLVTSRRLEVADARLAVLFGRWRYDAAYLLPMFTTRSNAKVVVYLGRGRFPLTVLEFPAPVNADDPLANVSLDFDPYEPRLAALHALVDRELPILQGSDWR